MPWAFPGSMTGCAACLLLSGKRPPMNRFIRLRGSCRSGVPGGDESRDMTEQAINVARGILMDLDTVT